MKARLDLRLSQRLIMTPQLQQAIKLLQLSRLELSQVVAQEMMENPALEELTTEVEETEAAAEEILPAQVESAAAESQSDTPENVERTETNAELTAQWEEYLENDRPEERSHGVSRDSEEFPSYEQTLTRPPSLEEHLLWQLRLSSVAPDDVAIGELVIGNIDEDGYLQSEIGELAQISGVPPERVERVIKQIQQFDPPGVAARDLVECLLIQLEQLKLRSTLIDTLVVKYLKDLEARRYPQIARELGVTLEEVVTAVKVIEGLEPKPGRPFAASDNYAIIPDVYVIKAEDGYVVSLNDDGMPKLRLNSFYRRMLMNRAEVQDGTRSYLEERFRSAVWLIRSIEQRNKTICRVTQSIVKFQREFFEHGVTHLRPLVLRQVAEDIGMHESTISRVTTNKYVHTPQGIYELKFFFNSSVPLTGDGSGEVSSISVRDMIKKMVAAEDARSPLRDQEIVERLLKDRVSIARRTVAKYRTELNIPPASKRKRYM
jgi:RNA polymerase sigma-54 factor